MVWPQEEGRIRKAESSTSTTTTHKDGVDNGVLNRSASCLSQPDLEPDIEMTNFKGGPGILPASKCAAYMQATFAPCEKPMIPSFLRERERSVSAQCITPRAKG